MKYHCDALLPKFERYSSFKFRRLSRYFNPYKVEKAYMLELAIFARTPGLNLNHVGLMLQWDRVMLETARTLIVPHYADEADAYTLENYASIAEDDGLKMLTAILDGNPHRAGTVPLHVTRYLQSRRRNGSSVAGLAREFGTTPARIQRWWTADIFDPLTGQPRDPSRLVGHRYFRPRPGVVI